VKYKHKGAHLYERFVTTKDKVIFKCMIPNCTHFLTNPDMVINRLTRCWGECGRELVYTKEHYQDKIKKPLCDECREERKIQRTLLSQIPNAT